MTVTETIAARYSCRAYNPDRLPEQAKIDAIVEAARLAPSACNRQPWRFALIGRDDEEGRQAIFAAYPREWVLSAPLHIVACAVPAEAWVRPADSKNHSDVDVAIATEHICLEASAQGLGTCWICNFDPAVLTAGLALPEGAVPVAVIPVGYAADGAEAPAKKRKATDEILLVR